MPKQRKRKQPKRYEPEVSDLEDSEKEESDEEVAKEILKELKKRDAQEEAKEIAKLKKAPVKPKTKPSKSKKLEAAILVAEKGYDIGKRKRKPVKRYADEDIIDADDEKVDKAIEEEEKQARKKEKKKRNLTEAQKNALAQMKQEREMRKQPKKITPLEPIDDNEQYNEIEKILSNDYDWKKDYKFPQTSACEMGKKMVQRMFRGKKQTYCRKDTGPTVKWLRQQLKEHGQAHKTKQGTSIWKARKPLLLRMYNRRVKKPYHWDDADDEVSIKVWDKPPEPVKKIPLSERRKNKPWIK